MQIFLLFCSVIFLICQNKDFESELLQNRKNKDSFFLSSPQSPLSKSDKLIFKGLNYYQAETRFIVHAEFIKDTLRPLITMPTSKGLKKDFIREGKLIFQLNSKMYSLSIFKATFYKSDDYFLPFRDLTNNDDTYATGRYMEIKPDSLGNWTIDFNLAYNPYCDYSDSYNCPIPQGFNFINERIEAGEKRFKLK